MISNSPFRVILGLLILATSYLAQEAKNAAAPSDPTPSPAPKVLAITGGRVLLDTANKPEPATIVVTDGKITAVGKDVTVPKGARTIDATGRLVAPSWIDAGNAGLVDPTAFRERTTANDAVADLLVPFDSRLRTKLLNAGVGCIYIDFGRTGRLYRSPTAAVAFVDPEPIEVEILERRAGASFRVAPANIRQVDVTSSNASLRNITAAFSAAARHKKAIEKHEKAVKDYEKKLAAWEKKKAAADKKSKTDGKGKTPSAPQEKKPKVAPKPPSKASAKSEKDEKPKPPKPLKPDPGSDTMLRILDGEAPLRVEAHWREDILNVLGLVKDKKSVHVSILGGSEAWRCIDELKEAGASVVLGPPFKVGGSKVLEYRARADIARILAENGVPFAFMTALGAPTSGGAVSGYRFDSLPLVASLAMAEGLSAQHALQALTSEAARVIAMGDRLGKIKPGYDAALQILRGEPLHPDTVVERMILGDRVIDLTGRSDASVL